MPVMEMSEAEIEIQNKKIDQLERLIRLGVGQISLLGIIAKTNLTEAAANQSITLEIYKEGIEKVNFILNDTQRGLNSV